MIFDEIESALSIWDRISKWFRPKQINESVATRFVRLYESHGVHKNQIPRFLGHGLKVADVKDDESLLPKLTEDVLSATVKLFAIRREWLDGAEDQIHPCHDFYKYPDSFSKFLDSLKEANPDGYIQGVLIAPMESCWEAEALLVLQETAGHIGDKPIYRYHLCNNWRFSYWKARAYLTACVAIACERRVYIHGVTKLNSEIAQLYSGETLLGWQGKGIWALGHTSWYPEDMALRTEVFLNGIDPEENESGIKNGLELWLKLESQGFMDTGLVTNARPFFQQALEQYSN